MNLYLPRAVQRFRTVSWYNQHVIFHKTRLTDQFSIVDTLRTIQQAEVRDPDTQRGMFTDYSREGRQTDRPGCERVHR